MQSAISSGIENIACERDRGCALAVNPPATICDPFRIQARFRPTLAKRRFAERYLFRWNDCQQSNRWVLDRSLAPSIIQEIANLVVTYHRRITPVGVIEGSRGLSEAKPPDIVAGYIVDPEGITADSRRNLRSPPGSKTSHANETGGVP